MSPRRPYPDVKPPEFDDVTEGGAKNGEMSLRQYIVRWTALLSFLGMVVGGLSYMDNRRISR